MSNKTQLARKLDKDAVSKAKQRVEAKLVPEFMRRNGPFIGEHLLELLRLRREMDALIARNV